MTKTSAGLGRLLSIFITSLLATSALSGCNGVLSGKLFKERAAETPAPDDYGIDKSFFVNSDGKPKTFLCAWAPEVGRGEIGESIIMPFVNEAAHCNIEFEITESYLVGRIVNPSFLNDRSRWREMLRIPITKHYYYERNKDQYGRDTNEWIENSSRSHWSARPKMKLDLAHMEVLQFSDESDMQLSVTSVQDIDWDMQNNFLGFSINANISFPHWYGPVEAQTQARFRINFLKFDHDPSFQKVPYDQEDAKYMNILHVMGRQIEGIEPELYAGHWDLRKQHRIYISGAPADIQPKLVAAIYKWDLELQKIGAVPQGHNVFLPVLKDLDHPFDLRYPSITWIEDRRISLNAPLGIGMAHADVRNGEILWGGVVLFGGMLERYINAYAPVENDSNLPTVQSLLPFQQVASMFAPKMRSVPALDPTTMINYNAMLNIRQGNFLEQEMAKLNKVAANPKALPQPQQNILLKDKGLNTILTDLTANISAENIKVDDFFQRMTVQKLLGSAGNAGSQPGLPEMAKKQGQLQLAKVLEAKDPSQRAKLMRSIRPNSSPFFMDQDNTFQAMVGSWSASKAQSTRTYPEMLDSVVASLIVHEWGHVLGLGHQFKENIIPKEGTVPSHFIRELSEKATPQREFTNMTSVMGYQSGRTEMMTPADEYVPGPQDDLVLHYLYKDEYSVYNKDKDSFEYIKMPASGKIPGHTQVGDSRSATDMPTAYFPQCNDFEASLGADPFCNRWDRGNKAEDIVKSYFELISDNLLTSMYSVVKGGGNPQGHEAFVWYNALDTFSRVRLFYDEMRRRLRSEPRLKPLWDELRSDPNALFEFSKTCQQDDPTDTKTEVLRQIFQDKSIVDLCRANAVALKELGFFLNLPVSDYTRIDASNKYVASGYLAGDGNVDYGHAFGSWYQMSNLPLKFSALYTMSSANSYMLWGGWLVPNFYYDNEENRYLYRTLYPTETTRLISQTVDNNMAFAADGRDDHTSMGRSVLALGSLLPWEQMSSNDAARLPREYNDELDQQTKFNFSMVAVLIEPVKPDAASNVQPDHYKKFTGQIYDFFTGKSTTARDVFMLPNGDVLVWAPRMFIYPISKIKFYSGLSSYVIAYKVDYDEGPLDPLAQDSLKRTLLAKHDDILNNCVTGFDGNGLLTWFDTANEKFEGFKILSGIAEESTPEKLRIFYQSVADQFKNYETNGQDAANSKIPANFPIRSMHQICDEAMRGIGQISAAAAMANGYWLGITADYVEK